MEKTNTPAICVFCGSSFGTNPLFRKAAQDIGAGIAAHGWSLVFGGGRLGLMGDVASAAEAGGARVQGIIPGFLQRMEPQVSVQDTMIVTPHMQDRKMQMLQLSDAFIVLPGGLGTFDEFFEVATEAQLGVHNKPIIVVNVEGYFNALDAMVRDMIETGFAKPMIATLYHLAPDADTALRMLMDSFQSLAPSR